MYVYVYLHIHIHKHTHRWLELADGGRHSGMALRVPRQRVERSKSSSSTLLTSLELSDTRVCEP